MPYQDLDEAKRVIENFSGPVRMIPFNWIIEDDYVSLMRFSSRDKLLPAQWAIASNAPAGEEFTRVAAYSLEADLGLELHFLYQVFGLWHHEEELVNFTQTRQIRRQHRCKIIERFMQRGEPLFV